MKDIKRDETLHLQINETYHIINIPFYHVRGLTRIVGPTKLLNLNGAAKLPKKITSLDYGSLNLSGILVLPPT